MDNSKNLGAYLGKGNSIAHRHKGSVNRNTKALQVIKDRIIETVGKLDKASKKGDWLFDLAKSKPKLFVELLKRVLPTTGTLELPGAVTLQIIKTYEGVKGGQTQGHYGDGAPGYHQAPEVIKDDNNSTTSDWHAAANPVTPSN